MPVSAIDVNLHSRDVRCVLRRQERNHARDFFRLTKTLHGVGFQNALRKVVDGLLWQAGSAKIGVTIGPGATVFTRIPRSTSSAAAVLANDRNAALLAEYALVPGVPVVPATLVFKMIDAPSFRCGTAF